VLWIFNERLAGADCPAKLKGIPEA
jgi:hypothetical protein